MEENTTIPSLPASSGQPVGEENNHDTQPQSKTPVILIGVGVLVVILIVVAAVLLLRADNQTTGRVRDVFIIFMALESLIIGAALVVLIVQLATLINLLQNEIKPIITSTSETVNTLKGTISFLSNNLSEPVITLNAYLAGIKQFFDVMRPGGRSKR
jgi:hypothetical protein